MSLHSGVWRLDQIEIGQLFARGGVMFRVVALIDDPVAVLEPIDNDDGGREHHVIGSPLFAEFDRVVFESPTGAINWSGKQA